MLRRGKSRFASLGVVLILVLAPVALSVNAAASLPKAAPGQSVFHHSAMHGNLHGKAAFVRFLRAHGLKRAGVVVQRGLRNYAGPHCPGAGWNCTSTKRPVVQMTDPGGSSYFYCTGSSTPSNSCTVVQAGLNNVAACIEHSTGPSQDCTITQTSSSTGNNKAYVEQIIVQSGLASCPGSQDASQTATITQTTGGNGSNSVAVVQAIAQFTNQNKLQCQDAREVVDITQNSASGNNTALTGQGEWQTEIATGAAPLTPINQQQNTKPQGSSRCQDFGDFGDQPNICVVLHQTAVNSTQGEANTAAAGQLIDQEQTASPAQNQLPSNITQTQGTLAGAEDMERSQNGSDKGKLFDLQVGDQDQNAPFGAHQTQDPPLHNPDTQNCTTSDCDTIVVQLLEQEANSDAAQTADLRVVCSSSGTPPHGCRVHQVVTNNVGTTTNDCGPSSFCFATIKCVPAVVIEEVTIPAHCNKVSSTGG